MNNDSAEPLVVVWGVESGPQGSGRPVQVGSELIGIAESLDDLDRILSRAGIDPDTAVVWRDNRPNQWE